MAGYFNRYNEPWQLFPLYPLLQVQEQPAFSSLQDPPFKQGFDEQLLRASDKRSVKRYKDIFKWYLAEFIKSDNE